ncbi:hypothetical protein [Paenibacillus sp. N3/727]|nr:hypothetical protein [Paenibacillus sp. N3/727]
MKQRWLMLLIQGHEFWVDESIGFTKEQQDALVHHLLYLQMK